MIREHSLRRPARQTRLALPHARTPQLHAPLSAARAHRRLGRRRLEDRPRAAAAKGGRLGTASPVATALLETRGARTGQTRRNAVIYFHDGDRVTIIASNAGRPGNPSWFYNARANPEVLFGGQPFRAEIVEDDASRERLWELADLVFPAFAAYRDTAGRAGRTIPILQLANGALGLSAEPHRR